MSDLIERLECAVEFIDTDEDQRLADLCDQAVHEILRLRNRVWELEDKLHAARVGACEVSDEKGARIRELENQLADQIIRVAELEEYIEDMKELENAAYARGVRDGIDRIRLLLGEILDGSTKGD